MLNQKVQAWLRSETAYAKHQLVPGLGKEAVGCEGVATLTTTRGPPPSEQEAASTIQAHWRGFKLRRTRPLEKLQLVYQVRQDLKEHMQVLADSAQWEKVCSDPKERLRWSECAMVLLLRLDSVQGAHSDVRDIRKIVTKEVLAFQEIIDSTSKDASTDVIRRALKSTLTTFL